MSSVQTNSSLRSEAGPKPEVVLIILGELARPWEENSKIAPSLSGEPYDLFNGTFNGEPITVLRNQIDSPNAEASVGTVVRAMRTFKASPNTGVFHPRFRLLADHHQTLPVLSIPVIPHDDHVDDPEEEIESVCIEWNGSALTTLANIARTAGASMTVSPDGTINIALEEAAFV